MKSQVIINCGFVENDQAMMLPFFLVENKRGKFVAHWTAMPKSGVFDLEHFEDMGRMKVTQLECLKAPWLAETWKSLEVIRVVDGKEGTMEQKIRSLCEDMAPSSRVIFVLPTRKDDGAIYKALELWPPENSRPTTMEAAGITCAAPFQIVPLGR